MWHEVWRDGDCFALAVKLAVDAQRMFLNSGVVEDCSNNQRMTTIERAMGSNPLCYLIKVWPFSFSHRRPSSLSCINEYLAKVAIDSGANVSV